MLKDGALTTQSPSQDVRPSLHSHLPFVHVSQTEHWLPQEPQLLLSVSSACTVHVELC